MHGDCVEMLRGARFLQSEGKSLLGGRGGKSIESGKHIASEGNVPLCNLYVSMLDRMGIAVEQFGDSERRLF